MLPELDSNPLESPSRYSAPSPNGDAAISETSRHPPHHQEANPSVVVLVQHSGTTVSFWIVTVVGVIDFGGSSCLQELLNSTTPNLTASGRRWSIPSSSWSDPQVRQLIRRLPIMDVTRIRRKVFTFVLGGYPFSLPWRFLKSLTQPNFLQNRSPVRFSQQAQHMSLIAKLCLGLLFMSLCLSRFLSYVQLSLWSLRLLLVFLLRGVLATAAASASAADVTAVYRNSVVRMSARHLR
ncbi:hypothetical protein BD410DRAFT_804821 [Rickenella mellea]|uniref:Uncharacterized protein n=1 Tax=Rickenella mellea TaxID=50990 RepID=A0A4Y7PZV0_9AGAM|nr:hypothetical protein BD410DRAFT_804821 [Rickenella mellea]